MICPPSDHVFKLPPRYFEHRPTGVIAVHLHGVENIREFVATLAPLWRGIGVCPLLTPLPILKRLTGLLLLGVTAACMCAGSNATTLGIGQPSVLERAKAGKALWEEKCRTAAGEKIYRKVENVEGILLLKVRPQASDREWADPMWPGAAFASEAFGDDYLNTFLGYEYASGSSTGEPSVITPKHRGYINTDRRAGGVPGYRYVDVINEKDGKRYRYVLVQKPRPASKIGWIDTVLDRKPAPDPAPRYGVTYEDHVIAEDRALGVASSTIRVLDLQTKEVLGEMIRYAWTPGRSSANPSPWLTAYKCPSHSAGSDALTRKFVDQVLIPSKGY
jgi:hypothetical protein